jgi:acyl-CoA synthetase (NDP forming)
MVRSGVEILVGAVQDPVFGPLIALGPGGTLAELIGDAAFRLAPLTDSDARELVRAGRAGRLLSGFRGSAPADLNSIEDLLLRVSQLAEDLPELAELDLNPVIAGPSGCVIVDARVRLAQPPPKVTLKSW